MSALIFSITNLIVVLSCVVLLFILIKYGRNKTHYVLAFFNLVTGIWGVGGFLIGLAQNSSAAMIAWKIGLLGSVPSVAVLYHLVVSVGNLKRRNLVRLFYFLTAFIYFLILFNLAGLKIVQIRNSLYFIQATDFRFLFCVIIWVGIVLLSIFELYRLVRNSSGNKRIQYQYLFVAYVIGWTGAILDALPMIGFYVFSACNMLIALQCIITTYAILRHQLMDIRVIVRRTLIFTLLFAIVYGLVSLLVFGVNVWLVR